MDQAAIAELTSYPLTYFHKGDNILPFDDNENATLYVYYMIEGHAMRQVTTIAGEEIFFEEYHPGKTVYALLGPYMLYTTSVMPANANAMIALTDIRAHQLTAIEFDAFLDRHPEVMKELLRRLTSEYTTLMNNFVAKQKGQAAPRVAGFILERANEIDGRLIFSRCCSVSDIARFLGMHRITANKIILALRHAGAIAYNDDNVLEILDPELLEGFAQGIRKIDYKK